MFLGWNCTAFLLLQTEGAQFFRFYCQLLLAYASAFRILNVFIRVFSSGSSDDGPLLEMLAEKSVRGNDESESWWFIHSHTRTHRSTTD